MSKKRSRQQCSQCCFWEAAEEDESGVGLLGFCKRYPPVLNLELCAGDLEARAKMDPCDFWWFPMTTGTDWCGEYRNKDA